MKLYNTLTRSVDEVKPISSSMVTVYTCGPTVYDYPHIGNWFTFIRYDILIRALKAEGLKPNWVMNITDVGHLVSDADEGEDKLEKGARRENKTAWDIAKFYGDYFVNALGRLNFTVPDYLPKATDHIKEQIEIAQKLENNGYTYIIDDGLYYDTSRFKSYSDFAQLNLHEQQDGGRVAVNPQKRNPSDFALWKFSPKEQQRDMEWDSPWGLGFPGWHLECSAMAAKYLGEILDIHAGGIDHIPVHHTNEIAQSEAANNKRFANVWMHANHVLVEGEKISKSLGNGVTLEDVEAKGYSLEALRLLVLESHYQSQSKFSWDSLNAAHNRLKVYQATAALRWQAKSGLNDASTIVLKEVPAQMIAIMGNNLDTPRALAYLSTISTQLDTLLVDQDKTNQFNNVDDFTSMLGFIDQIFGLNLMKVEDITDGQKRLMSERDEARDAQDWAASDKLRDELKEQGIGVRDTDHGQIWFRT